MLPWFEAPLRELLASQRGHAVLLAGPPGIGQFELALALAQAWLCEAPPKAPRQPCGECSSCKLVQARTHPDLLVLLPEALQEELGWSLGDAEVETAKAKASKAKPSKEIKVEALRRAVEFAQQTSSRGVAKVVLVHPAERMNTISANTLLKTLEEPPGQARFVLSSEAIEALLPTIRSRCQLMRLAPPAEAMAREWLQAQGLAGADVLLAAAGQYPLAAQQLVRQGLNAAAWQELPGRLAAGEAAALSGWPVPLAVETLQKVCHDALCVTVGAQPRYFPAASFKGLRAGLAGLTAWGAELRRAARHEEHAWNAGLMLDALVGQARRALHSAA
ncbi:DNA polymerase III subunit delta' [Aquabacterium sp. A7-Y]|uniref:DNA polymerase III subunit delta' n=1 Tax=Aquabacterium sp. A7-Y TaxID=1349605 RepID=UPI00223CD144|nr:DNA polymerase III subunit delta' [Aquabacterium sp. A7-Y]MCW7540616.1 DNA polymerase III subunit delta' [Aquabacterium sp. A7-Y]